MSEISYENLRVQCFKLLKNFCQVPDKVKNSSQHRGHLQLKRSVASIFVLKAKLKKEQRKWNCRQKNPFNWNRQISVDGTIFSAETIDRVGHFIEYSSYRKVTNECSAVSLISLWNSKGLSWPLIEQLFLFPCAFLDFNWYDYNGKNDGNT